MRLFRWPSAAIFVLSLILLTPGLLAQSNGVKSIQTVGANVEITVNSAQEFDVRDEVVTLQIGSRNFSNSRSPSDGDTRTLIFTLTQSEWDSLSTGDAIVVGWGADASSNPRNFGTLDKSRLNK
jgi:hypothetical protein